MLSRIGEMIFSILSIVTNFLSFVSLLLLIFLGNLFKNDPNFKQGMESELIRSGFTPSEIEATIGMTNSMLNFVIGFVWLFLVLSAIAIVITIIGIVKMKTDAKTAGILFFVSSFLSGVVTVSGLLLIVSGIMCVVRKEENEHVLVDTSNSH